MPRTKATASENIEQEILFIKDVAKLLGRSEAAIKFALHDKSPWLPPSFKQGRHRCWLLSTIRQHLKQQEQLQLNPPRKPGRPRKTPA